MKLLLVLLLFVTTYSFGQEPTEVKKSKFDSELTSLTFHSPKDFSGRNKDVFIKRLVNYYSEVKSIEIDNSNTVTIQVISSSFQDLDLPNMFTHFDITSYELK